MWRERTNSYYCKGWKVYLWRLHQFIMEWVSQFTLVQVSGCLIKRGLQDSHTWWWEHLKCMGSFIWLLIIFVNVIVCKHMHFYSFWAWSKLWRSNFDWCIYLESRVFGQRRFIAVFWKGNADVIAANHLWSGYAHNETITKGKLNTTRPRKA